MTRRRSWCPSPCSPSRPTTTSGQGTSTTQVSMSEVISGFLRADFLKMWCIGYVGGALALWFARGFGWCHSLDPLSSSPHPGRIKAIQLEYSEARRTMTNALRKAPQHTAVGFKQTVSSNSHPFATCSSDNTLVLCPYMRGQGRFP